MADNWTEACLLNLGEYAEPERITIALRLLALVEKGYQFPKHPNGWLVEQPHEAVGGWRAIGVYATLLEAIAAAGAADA